MKKTMLIAVAFLLLSIQLFSQKIVREDEITMANLGDRQMYANYNDEVKTPLDGECRIITGVATSYFEAKFKAGYATGKWKLYIENKLIKEFNYKEGYLDSELIEYNELGKIIKKCNFLKGEPHGTWEDYHNNGQLHQKGSFNNGKRMGTWESYYNDGEINEKTEYVNDLLTKRISYHSNGQIAEDENYKNGKEHGTFKKFDNEGNLITKLNYVDGKQVGKQMRNIFNGSGNYTISSNYNTEGKLDGDYQVIYDDRKTPKETGKYSEGQKDGTWNFFKEDGLPTRTEEYLKGDLRRKISYFTNGDVEWDCAYLKGSEHGVSKRYTYQGVLILEQNYKNGKEVGKQYRSINPNSSSGYNIEYYCNDFGEKHGKYTETYISNKKIRVTGSYVNDKRDGIWTVYEHGEIKSERTYKNDKKVGKQRIIKSGYSRGYVEEYSCNEHEEKHGKYTVTYLEDKSPKTIGNYINGKREGTWTEYENGEIKLERTYKNDKRVGKQRELNSNRTGKYMEEFFYNDYGNKDGKYTATYLEDNSPKTIGNYINGKREGTWTEYENGKEIAERTYKNDKEVGKQRVLVKSYAGDYLEEYNCNEYAKKDGKYTANYTDNNTPKEKGQYTNGKREGLWIYYENGKITAEKTYKNDKEVGRQMKFIEGRGNESDYFEHFSLNERRQRNGEYQLLYAADNKVKTKGEYNNGQKSGKWEYYNYGKLVKEEIYENGRVKETRTFN